MKIKIHDPHDSLYKLSFRIALAYDKLKTDFPNWKPNDARITAYAYCVNTIESVLFSMIFKKNQLGDRKWYANIRYITSPSDSQIFSVQENYDAFLMVALVTEYFACFEIFFRNIINVLFPGYTKNKIFEICEDLLEELKLKQYQSKFDLYRFTRNSLHNNGVVTDKHAYSILYNGVWYDFTYGKKINVDWLMLCQLSAELEECLNKIIYSTRISKPDFIKDSSYPEGDPPIGRFVLK